MSDEELFSRAFPAGKDDTGVSKLGWYAAQLFPQVLRAYGQGVSGKEEQAKHLERISDRAVELAESLMKALERRQKGGKNAGSV